MSYPKFVWKGRILREFPGRCGWFGGRLRCGFCNALCGASRCMSLQGGFSRDGNRDHQMEPIFGGISPKNTALLVWVGSFLMTGKQHFALPKHYSGKWVAMIFLGQVFIVGLITMDQRWLKNHLHGTTWFCGGCLLKHGSAANWWIFPRTRLGGANKIPWVQFTKIVEIYWTYTFISTIFMIEEHRPI